MNEGQNHIFIKDRAQTEKFTSISARGGEARIPKRDRIKHSERLRRKFKNVWKERESFEDERTAVSIPTRSGTYLQFKSKAGYDLITKSLEDIRQGVRLLNVKYSDTDNNDETIATVYVPASKESLFIKKITDYLDPEKDSNPKGDKPGNPRNYKLINSIEDVQIALLESLWTDNDRLMPDDRPIWCEVWIRNTDSSSDLFNFQNTLETLSIEFKGNYLKFPERSVFMLLANKEQLVELLNQSDLLAELRYAQETAELWVNENPIDQADWVEDLLSRLKIEESNVIVAVLDSGVNNGHRLISPILSNQNCLAVDPNWGTDDHEPGSGHGTLMAGIVAYNSLEEVLSSGNQISVLHKLCSVKVIPRPNQNSTPMEFWGDVTQQAINRAEIANTDAQITFCLAVTAKEGIDQGRPSSWSGAIDQYAFDPSKRRLIIISAGNTESHDWPSYPDSNKTKSVENPGQAWNALTVGAHTQKVIINDPSHARSSPMAQANELSPYSTTSFNWDTKWPYKPDVVFEGGNVLRNVNGDYIDGYDDYSLLSTSANIPQRQFDTIWATSAATAKASWFAAQIRLAYPEAWPETVRGLIVHSASWTDQMRNQFNINMNSKDQVKQLIRICGYGIPDYNKAIYSAGNGLTFIAQETIQPFEKKKGSQPSTKEMHFFQMPWPKDELLTNPDVDVTVRITLSYFIDPGPGEIGWRDKYRYRSHGFGFDLNSPGETEEDFKKRINKAVRKDGEELDNVSGSDRWLIGSQGRKVGSIHSDIWHGTAADVASCDMIGVFPIIGWWKLRTNLKMFNSKARYSLIISLETPAQNLDLLTPVLTKIKSRIPIMVTTRK